MTIYCNNAATSIHKAPGVSDAIVHALGGYNSSRGAGGTDATHTLFSCREHLAHLFGAPDSSRVILTSGATEAINTALFGLDCHIICGRDAHNASLRPLYHKQGDSDVSWLYGLDAEGYVDRASYKQALLQKPGLVVLTLASNVTGIISNVAHLAELAHEAGAKVLVDASQAAGHYPIDMCEMGIDLLAAPGHKGLLGPSGIGCLIINGDIDIAPLKFGGTGSLSYEHAMPKAYPERLEAGTPNHIGVAGLNAAVQYLLTQDIQEIYAQEAAITAYFVRRLQELQADATRYNFEILGSVESLFWEKESIPEDAMCVGHTGAISMRIEEDAPGPDVLSQALADTYQILTRAGLHCAPLIHKHFGTDSTGALRFSFDRNNTKDEVDAVIVALTDLLERR